MYPMIENRHKGHSRKSKQPENKLTITTFVNFAIMLKKLKIGHLICKTAFNTAFDLWCPLALNRNPFVLNFDN